MRKVQPLFPYKCFHTNVEILSKEFLNLESTREALHVGSLQFHNRTDVFNSMSNEIMKSGLNDLEFCLDQGYKTLLFDGNFDIICNHSGVLAMLADMQWIGKSDYEEAVRDVYHERETGEVIGYLTSAQALRVLVVRNAGHMVSLNQPLYSQQMIEDFTSQQL